MHPTCHSQPALCHLLIDSCHHSDTSAFQGLIMLWRPDFLLCWASLVVLGQVFPR